MVDIGTIKFKNKQKSATGNLKFEGILLYREHDWSNASHTTESSSVFFTSSALRFGKVVSLVSDSFDWLDFDIYYSLYLHVKTSSIDERLRKTSIP